MSRSDNTEFRMYLVVTDIKGGAIRQRFEYGDKEEKGLEWRGPGVDAKLRAERQVKWLREQGADLKGARVMYVSDRLAPEAWEDEQSWWKFARKTCVFVDLPRRGRPSTDEEINSIQRQELAAEAYARGGMDAYNEIQFDW